MSFERNNGQENIIILGNNQNQNISMNTQNSNYSNNIYSSQNEPSRAASREASINLRKEMASNNSSVRGADSTITSNGLGRPKILKKKKSLNKNEQQMNLINKNKNGIIEDENNNREESEENNYNNNYNVGLETIMEVPPLTKIEKKANIYEFYINDSKKTVKICFTLKIKYPQRNIIL